MCFAESCELNLSSILASLDKVGFSKNKAAASAVKKAQRRHRDVNLTSASPAYHIDGQNDDPYGHSLWKACLIIRSYFEGL